MNCNRVAHNPRGRGVVHHHSLLGESALEVGRRGPITKSVGLHLGTNLLRTGPETFSIPTLTPSAYRRDTVALDFAIGASATGVGRPRFLVPIAAVAREMSLWTCSRRSGGRVFCLHMSSMSAAITDYGRGDRTF